MTKEEFDIALPYALELYTQFYNELMTALDNIADNSKGAQWRIALEHHDRHHDANRISYFMGKEDAYREIAERIRSEYQMHFDQAQHFENHRYFQIARDKDVDEVYPRSVRINHRLPGDIVFRHQRALASMLEHYFNMGFSLGCGHKDGKDIKPYNPTEFGDELINAVIPSQFLKDIEFRRKSEDEETTN